MVTVVTHVHVKDGREKEWDEVFSKRLQTAREQKGFEFVQLCQPDGAPNERVIVGTWQTHDDWESWHQAPEFVETRHELEKMDDESGQSRWYNVVFEERR